MNHKPETATTATASPSTGRWKNRIVRADGTTWLGTLTWPSREAAKADASNFGVGDDMLSEQGYGYVLIGKGDVIDQVSIG